MELIEESYMRGLHIKEGAYIHRYYLPKKLQEELQPRDMTALYYNKIKPLLRDGKNSEETRALMLEERCSIRYQTERIIKEIPINLLAPAIDACVQYNHDKWDWSLTTEETDFLIALNERLGRLEHDINTECCRLNQEMHARQERGEPFLDDYEIEVKLEYQLRDEHTLSRDNDDNFIYESTHWKTERPNLLEEWIRKDREQEGIDWNDARGAENPAIRDNPLFNVPHCWLFHELQSRSPVPIKHLCGIGTIWVEIHDWHQGFIEMGKEM